MRVLGIFLNHVSEFEKLAGEATEGTELYQNTVNHLPGWWFQPS